GNLVYVGGQFSAIGGQPRSCVAAVDAGTGLATPWNPSANGLVRCLAVCANTLIVGGQFTVIGGQPRSYLAAIDVSTGLATKWAPNPNDWVWSLAQSGSAVYAGGWFSQIGGAQRNSVAALDAGGTATLWNARLDAQAVVNALAVSDSTLFIGGSFSSAAGQ